MMFEIYTVIISSLMMGLLSAVSAWVDGHARDDEAWRAWNSTHDQFLLNPFTRYHMGEPWDAWHIMRRVERYGFPVVGFLSGLMIGSLGNWQWVIITIVCWALAGTIGFQAASKWKGSIWTNWMK